MDTFLKLGKLPKIVLTVHGQHLSTELNCSMDQFLPLLHYRGAHKSGLETVWETKEEGWNCVGQVMAIEQLSVLTRLTNQEG